MKKRFLLFVMILSISLTGVFAQEDNFDLEGFNLGTMTDAFGGFAESVAAALPMATTVGLQWSDAYIGNLPHFGIGASVGFASLPLSAMEATLNNFLPPEENPIGELSSMLDFLGPIKNLVGFPFPAAAIDLRIGGIILPFDIGAKVGFIPDEVYGIISDATGGVLSQDTLDYFLLGFDIRYALVKEPKGFSLIPDISVGGGYNYYRGKFAFPMPEMIIDVPLPIPDPASIGFGKDMITNEWRISNAESGVPAIGFDWESHVIDVKAQISKKILLLFTPYVGVGASYSRSKAGGGLYSAMTVEKNGATSDMEALNAELGAVQAAVDSYGDDIPEEYKDYISDEGIDDFGDIQIPAGNEGFVINKWQNGWGFRAFGGLSINIWVLKIDTSLMYDFLGESLGAQVGVRLQF